MVTTWSMGHAPYNCTYTLQVVNIFVGCLEALKIASICKFIPQYIHGDFMQEIFCLTQQYNVPMKFLCSVQDRSLLLSNVGLPIHGKVTSDQIGS